MLMLHRFGFTGSTCVLHSPPRITPNSPPLNIPMNIKVHMICMATDNVCIASFILKACVVCKLIFSFFFFHDSVYLCCMHLIYFSGSKHLVYFSNTVTN